MQLILAVIAAGIIRALRVTWRVRLSGPDPYQEPASPKVFCFWHGRQLGLFAHPQRNRLAVLTSLSRDGTLQAKILRLLGFHICRGSSSRRGAAGLKGIIDALNNGCDGAFAVDGPRGPACRVKFGAILAAKKSGAQLLPITTRYSSAWTFGKAWDRYAIPKPFARVDILRGKPVSIRGRSMRSLARELEESLLSLGDTPAHQEESWEAYSTSSSG